MKATKLKPCPMCGAEAWLVTGGGMRCHPWAEVRCTTVDCSVRSKHVTDYSGRNQVATAIAIWNRRVKP